MTTKKCIDCTLEKDISEFKKYSNHDKYRLRCNECQAIYMSYVRALNNTAEANVQYAVNMYKNSKRSISFISRALCQPEDIIISVLTANHCFIDKEKEKHCPNCNEVKTLNSFSKSQRVINHGWCRECVYTYDIERRQDEDKLQRKKDLDHQYYLANQEKAREYNQQYYLDNKEELLRNQRRYHKENYDIVIKPGKDKYRYKNPEKIAEWSLKYKMNVEQATVAWANLDKIREIYKLRNKLTNETGIPHHVDHIIPLNGRNVCGLHVEYNLQILSEVENKKKSNKF